MRQTRVDPAVTRLNAAVSLACETAVSHAKFECECAKPPFRTERERSVAFRAEALDRPLHLGLGVLTPDPVSRFHVLARLQVLVMNKEVFDRLEFVRRHVVDLLDVVPALVAGRHAQHLVVAAGFIGHPEHADRSRFDDHAGEHRLRHQHQRVEWVAVLAERVLDEPVVGGVGHRRVQVAVQPHPPRLVVHLVFVALALRDLDGHVELHAPGSFTVRRRDNTSGGLPCTTCARRAGVPLPDSAPQPTPAGLAAALSQPLANRDLGQLTGRVTDAISGTQLWEQGSQVPLKPASTNKLLTAGAALLTLNHDARQTTTVMAADQTKQPGLIVLVGAGDPTLSSAAPGQEPRYHDAGRIADLAAQIRNSGIKVTAIQVDGSLFSGPSLAPGWDPADIQGGDMAPI